MAQENQAEALPAPAAGSSPEPSPLSGRIRIPDRNATPRAPNRAAIAQALSTLAGRRVAVAMSGGVDSAIAALLLKKAGAEPIGLSLRLHDPDPDNPLAPRACCPPDDLQDARRVAEQLDIPFYVIDGRASFNDAVVKPFVNAYLLGRTPNPCVGCNSFVKLDRLAHRARALGCEALATGHYARIAIDADGAPHLFAGVDQTKDQSYFLFGTAPDVLRTLVFPLGAMTKSDVREAALRSGLPVAHKLESQEVCFVGGAGAGKFVMRQPEAAGDHEGAIIDADGNELGRHPGVMNYTIGQRRGIGIAAKHPLHVIGIDADRKTLTVGASSELLRSGLTAVRASWPAGVPESPVRATAKIRYRNAGTPCVATPLANGGVDVRFDTPVSAVAPGQAVVFYDGPRVLGGAWISEGHS